ncbi:TetR/AcrR family transcriptional regulator [Parachlamydia sp. AcF125]|uniref:TetR/AcrR family transcriptional regulator n=1 Tax=Parachlamydia sp. AcF125 TaxID=2795736 RepID=UPI001BCA60AF|nr:TetR/AcrR family transcriptional regulator [Parachlamydia sp. AcF125]
MSNCQKRNYKSETRQAQARLTRSRILIFAKKLFQAEGFEGVTIEKIAQASEVAASTIYALFQSKRGIVRALMDEAFSVEEYEALVEQVKHAKSSKERLVLAAAIARQMYDAEKAQTDIFRGASVLAPELKELEQEREQLRYTRQKETIEAMAKEQSLAKGLHLTQARDILWAFTGRDMYRLFVVEQGWSSEAYEKWLAQLLIKTLLKKV